MSDDDFDIRSLQLHVPPYERIFTSAEFLLAQPKQTCVAFPVPFKDVPVADANSAVDRCEAAGPEPRTVARTFTSSGLRWAACQRCTS